MWKLNTSWRTVVMLSNFNNEFYAELCSLVPQRNLPVQSNSFSPNQALDWKYNTLRIKTESTLVLRQAPQCSIPVALECFRRSSSLEERNICRGMHGQIGKCSNSTDSGASKCLRCSLNGHGNGGRMQSILGWLFEKQLIFV